MGEIPESLFGGELIANNLVSLRWVPGTHSCPPRLPVFISILLTRRYVEVDELVYKIRDHPAAIFLVLEGVFSACAMAVPHTKHTPNQDDDKEDEVDTVFSPCAKCQNRKPTIFGR